MIRPRPGDFCYTDRELEVMMRDIDAAKRLGTDGVVFGILTMSGKVDVERTKMLVQAARPMSITFHRAIDECEDVQAALGAIRLLGIDRVLTSGGKPDVFAGIDVLRGLVEESHGRPRILAGGGITLQNVEDVVLKTGVREVHALSALVVDAMSPGTTRVGAPRRYLVDGTKVRQMMAVLDRLR
jgi:copper homeostasis protein